MIEFIYMYLYLYNFTTIHNTTIHNTHILYICVYAYTFSKRILFMKISLDSTHTDTKEIQNLFSKIQRERERETKTTKIRKFTHIHTSSYIILIYHLPIHSQNVYYSWKSRLIPHTQTHERNPKSFFKIEREREI